MLNKREVLLVHVLIWVVVAGAFGIGLFLLLERRSDTLRKIRSLSEQVSKSAGRMADEGELARQKEQLSRTLALDRSGFYTALEMDPYRFGIIIRDLLLRDGLEIGRYQTLEGSGDNLLEFSVTGDALGLARFLQRVSGSPKRWHIPYLAVNAPGEKGKVQAVFRIGYEKIDEMVR
jgi:hypothetical protein